jgi:transposase
MNIPVKKGGRPSKRPSNEKLAELYQEMTAKEIAKKYKVSEYTVRNWINKARKEVSDNE